MFFRPGPIVLSLLLVAFLLIRAGDSRIPSQAGPAENAVSHHRPNLQGYGSLHLHFEPNLGQAPSRARFLSRGAGYLLALDPEGATLVVRNSFRSRSGSISRVRMRLVGATTSRMMGEESLTGKSNYFTGNDPKKWRASVPNFGSVRYVQPYPGVDLRFYGNQQRLEYDFEVAPGGRPDLIRLSFDGSSRQKLNADGNLVITAGDRDLVWRRPTLYQSNANHGAGSSNREFVSGSYVLRDDGAIGFRIGAYDPTRTLFIDPVLSYSTFLGGTQLDMGTSSAVDNSGNAYVAGMTIPTSSIGDDFPTTPGAFKVSCTTANPCAEEAFVTKLSSAGDTFVYSTYLGGSGNDFAAGIAVDLDGQAYVAGLTGSLDFPVTPGVIQPTFGGDVEDAFVTKLNANGSALVYSTYLGGSQLDFADAIAVDRSGNAYVAGFTGSNGPDDFPVTPGAYQTFCKQDKFHTCGDIFVSKLNPQASALVYSTYIGGTGFEEGEAIAVDSSGNAYIAGNTGSLNYPTTAGALQTKMGGMDDAFITKLNRIGSALEFSTYLGGSGVDDARGIAIDAARNVYVTGVTFGSPNSKDNFPTTTGAFQASYGGGPGDAFAAKVNSFGTKLLYATYLGGSADDEAFGIGVDALGRAYTTGLSCSPDFPVVNAIQPTNHAACNAFVTSLNATGSAAIYSTYFGGSVSEQGAAIAVDASGKAYFTGESCSPDMPIVNAAQPTPGDNNTCDAFVASIQ